ncbi:hypothetical protein RJD40_01620 [Vibrio scophthalmi]|uniref:hypothetical protein n=1 Tax=Vibrio scophthalmi TaxID=45658 RepID=UPI003AAABDDD
MIPGISTGGGGLSADLGGGPSSAGSTTNNSNGFTGGTIQFGNNGIPTWLVVGLVICGVIYVAKKK